MNQSSQPGAATTLSDPNGYGTAAQDAAVLADVQAALQVWTSHLDGLGTLTVQVTMVDQGGNGVLADGAPTLDVAQGTLDGHTLLQSGAAYELATGQHLGGGTDISIDVNTAYLDRLYLGGGTTVPADQFDGLSLFEHEITHGLGFGGETSGSGTLDPTYETLWDHFLADQDGTEVFTGPNAEAVNGGPVAVTTLANGEGYAHLANASSDPNADDLMSGLGLPPGVSRPISDVDLAILADVGVPVTGIAGTVTVSGTPGRATVGQAQLLSGLTLADTGALTSSTVTLVVSDASGTLAPASMATGAQVAASADGTTLTVTGSLAQVRAQLAELSYTAARAGQETLTLAARDGYGNAGSGTVVLSAAASGPAVASVTAVADAAGPLGAGHAVTFTVATTGPVTVGPNGTVDLALSDGGTARYDAGASTPTSLVFTATVTAGQDATNLTVTGLELRDGATLTAADGSAVTLDPCADTPGAASGLVVDTTAPQAPVLALASDPSATDAAGVHTDAATATFSGRSEPGSTIRLYEDGALVGTALASPTGSWSVSPASALPSGASTVTATATDAAGNVSSAATLTVVLDAPVTPASPTAGTAATAGTAPASTVVTLSAATQASLSADAGSSVVVADGGATHVAGNASASSTMTLFGNAGATSYANGGGTALVVDAGASSLSLTGGATGSSMIVFAGDAATSYAGGGGADEIIGGTGTLDLAGGAGGSLLVFGGTGAMRLTGGGEQDLVVGGAGAATIHAGAGGVFAGSGGSRLYANGSNTFLAGNVSGDQLTASTIGGDMLVAGAGNETLDGGSSANANLVFGGTGQTELILGAGADTVVAGAGASTVQAGSGDARIFLGSGAGDLLSFVAGRTGGTDVVGGFRAGTDHLQLQGYAGAPTVTVAGGDTTLGLSDGTRIVLLGVSVSGA